MVSPSVVILQTRGRWLQIHNSVSHALVANSSYTKTFVYFADDANDAVGRLSQRTASAPAKEIIIYHIKMAIKKRGMKTVKKIPT